MKLTNKQEIGLQLAVQRFKDHEAYTTIAGYAGTGKSTLVAYIVAALNLRPEHVAYISYTGKAAQVLRQKGCLNARTSHKLLYKSVLNEKTGKFTHIPRRYLDSPYKLIIVDEVSMLPPAIWQLLLSHHIPVIALGDPGQLPPVATEDNGVLLKPHIFLDEIMRQEEDNEIIQLTMDIRAGKPLELFNGKNVRIVDQSELREAGFWKWPNQILVGKNATRWAVNTLMRRELLHQENSFPVEGDKIICLKNDWDVVSVAGDALVNGLSGTISNIRPYQNQFAEKTFMADFMPDTYESCVFGDLEMDECIFTEHRRSKNKMNPEYMVPADFAPQQFDFGYAITVHKAQGSEFDNVLVFEEFMRSETRENHMRWLYTAATRASKKLIIVRNYRL